MTQTFKHVFLCTWGALGLSACDEKDAPPPPTPPAVLVTEYRPVKVDTPTKRVGEDCPQGESECLSNVCLHYKPTRGANYVCSQTCTDETDCAEDWKCAQVLPFPESKLCTPPETWVPAVAQPRAH